MFLANRKQLESKIRKPGNVGGKRKLIMSKFARYVEGRKEGEDGGRVTPFQQYQL